jgi:hypothetical protein
MTDNFAPVPDDLRNDLDHGSCIDDPQLERP